MQINQILVAGLLLTGSLTACTTPDTGPTDAEIFQSDQNTIQAYAKNKGLTGKLTASGVYIAITQPSSSSLSPAEGLEAEYTYTAYALLPGTTAGTFIERFGDSTYATKPRYAIILSTVAGISEGLVAMHEGDRADMFLPSFYGYGREGSADGLVPPNTAVRLDTRLRRVRTEAQQIDDYLTANKLVPTEITASGARIIKTVVNPAGALPTATQSLAVRYRGQLLRSTIPFDDTGTSTVAFKLGGTVPGFDESLARLRVGEKATIVFPSSAGYGTTGKGSIPPYAPLRFDIELVSAQ